MLAKINPAPRAISIFALALLLAGCTPAGPRALLAGKKCLDRGDLANAVTQLQRAASLLATNATAWNYLGVALQCAGRPDQAADAYQAALRCDRDLMEAHLNLGTLWLDQNKPDLAKAEFTAYTLRRPNQPVGWLKLASAQLRTGEYLPAERSYSSVLSLKANEAEAYNGLGIARLQEGKTRDAFQFFAAAVRLRPDFAAALQNLATVNLEYLHDRNAALANFQAYLALSPHPANYNEVKSLVDSLTQADVKPASSPKNLAVATAAPPVTVPKPAPATAPHTLETRPKNTSLHSPEPKPQPPVPVPTQTVRVQPEPELITTPQTAPIPPVPTAPVATPANPVTTVAENDSPVPPEPDVTPAKTGFWHRLVHPKTAATKPGRTDDSTPVPTDAQTDATQPPPKPAEPRQVILPRYKYFAPAPPAAGDRRTAEAAFTQARQAEQEANWAEASQGYQAAATSDPSWFEAQYNAGVIAHRLHNYGVALPRYELALAIQPASLDARYNFALALQAAGYAADAADELKKILTAKPDDVRTHLALANLCAQQLHDISQARQHYLQVLALQPDHPQAPDIRFWLSSNPE